MLYLWLICTVGTKSNNILFLIEKVSNGKSAPDPSTTTEASPATSSSSLKTQSRGSSEALKSIVRHFGSAVVDKLNVVIDWTIGTVNNASQVLAQGKSWNKSRLAPSQEKASAFSK